MVDLSALGTYFHLYGLILGLSLMVGIWLVQKKANQVGIKGTELESVLIWVIIGGVLGARMWHVMTDWPLYQENLGGALAIWQGGLSILGAVVGGGVAAAWYVYRHQTGEMNHLTFTKLLDVSVFGLPLAQALGRLGNYVNQELYGPPTDLPWAIFIDSQHRLPGLSAFETYHPLFAYEMIAMVIFGVGSWLVAAQPETTKRWKLEIGSGRWFALYLVYYSVIRFSLDFLRLEKALIPGLGLGINQVILVGVAATASVYLWYYLPGKKSHD